MGLIIKFGIFLAIFFFSSISSFAKFIVEPSYNYYEGTFESGDFTGQVYGINLGYLGEYFMAGITMETGKYSYDNNFNTDLNTQFDGGGIGTFLGFHLFDRYKLWTGYLNSTLEPTENNNIRYFGQHISYGIGYRLYEGLMINLYEFKNQFTQMEDDTTGKTSGLSSNIKTRGTNFSFSYMFIF